MLASAPGACANWSNCRARRIRRRFSSKRRIAIARCLDTLIASCVPSTLICVAVDLTLPGETIVTRAAADWKKANAPDLHKRPAIFLLLAS